MNWLSLRFELSRGGGASNVRPMEGLRGFAVFLVFLVHYSTLVQPWIADNPIVLSLLDGIHAVGNVGVDLFFVLSGYLIYGSLISRNQLFLEFIRRRIQRIYPVFTVVFFAYVILSYLFPVENKIPEEFLSGALFLVQNFLLLPGLLPIEPMISVAWSLSYELFYYLSIPLIVFLLDLKERSPISRVTIFSTAAVILIGLCAVLDGPIRLAMFAAGILLHEAVNNDLVPEPSSSVALLALLAGLSAPLLPIAGGEGLAIKVAVLFISFFLLCLTCFRSPAAWLPRAFSWTPLRWLGNMSYSYYLLHGLALKAGFLLLSKIYPATSVEGLIWFSILLPVMFSLTLFPSAFLFILVERPFSLNVHNAKATNVLGKAVAY